MVTNTTTINTRPTANTHFCLNDKFLASYSMSIRPTQPGHPSVGRCNEYQWKLGRSRHTVQCTSPVSLVWQCKLVSGWLLRKQRSSPPYWPCGYGMTLCFSGLAGEEQIKLWDSKN